MIVNGFIEPITKTLPMEYAVELSRLIELNMEGSVGCTGNTRFTPAASLALGGPDWLVERRTRAAERLADVERWPTASEEIWRYSRIGDFDLDRYRPLTETELGAPGSRTRRAVA